LLSVNFIVFSTKKRKKKKTKEKKSKEKEQKRKEKKIKGKRKEKKWKEKKKKERKREKKNQAKSFAPSAIYVQDATRFSIEFEIATSIWAWFRIVIMKFGENILVSGANKELH